MSIEQLQKLTIIGRAPQKSLVLDELQALGCLHVISLTEKTNNPPQLVSNEARLALKYLQTSPVHRRPSNDIRKYNRRELIHTALEIKRRREQLREERDQLKQAIEDLKPWGSFRLPDGQASPGLDFFFYDVPNAKQVELPSDSVWVQVSADQENRYIVAIGSPLPESLDLQPITLDSRPLIELKQLLSDVEEEYEELYWKRSSLTKWRSQLQLDLDLADDQTARLAVAQRTLDDEHLFAIQGWLPQRQRELVQKLADRFDLALTFEQPTSDDAPPTKLLNSDAIGGAEDCVTFYMTPGYRSWDPTIVMYFSFSLFFGMIVADAGYGLLFAVLLAFGWHRLAQPASRRRIRNLLFGIVISTVSYGVIIGSYFGLTPDPGTILGRLQVRIDGRPLMESQNAMMILAVTIGVAHLLLANLISAWHVRQTTRAIGHLGWGAMIVGGYAMGLSQLPGLSALWPIGIVVTSVGGFAVLFFSSNRPLISSDYRDYLWRAIDGLMQATNVSKAFGDILSYLRLFALGLASAQLAITFNGLAKDMSARGGLGIALALLILLVGHGINLLLGIMGGVVHGLRLNCIEFFNWSLTEEGYAFRPFQKKVKA